MNRKPDEQEIQKWERWAETKHWTNFSRALKVIRSQQEEIKQLRGMCKELYEHLDYCGWGDSWERECACSNNLPDRAKSIIEKE